MPRQASKTSGVYPVVAWAQLAPSQEVERCFLIQILEWTWTLSKHLNILKTSIKSPVTCLVSKVVKLRVFNLSSFDIP